MAGKFILIVKDGAIAMTKVSKPAAPRRNLLAWKSQCAGKALKHRVRRYAFRFGSEWHVLGVDYPVPIKSFPIECRAAAEMYLIHLEARDG